MSDAALPENARQLFAQQDAQKAAVQSMRQADDPLYSSALKQYPILQSVPFSFTRGNGPGFLEFWPVGEGGAPNQQRPSAIPMNQIGVEVRNPDTRPIDIMGDIASHYLIENDPIVKKGYESFVSSLDDSQKARLKEQYNYAVKNEGETRPYETWEKMSGLPGYFRGYLFKQWPDEFNQKAYTTDQRKQLDALMQYFTTPQSGKSR